jgi:hypothetical protein
MWSIVLSKQLVRRKEDVWSKMSINVCVKISATISSEIRRTKVNVEVQLLKPRCKRVVEGLRNEHETYISFILPDQRQFKRQRKLGKIN